MIDNVNQPPISSSMNESVIGGPQQIFKYDAEKKVVTVSLVISGKKYENVYTIAN
ncbi:MAG: hypothetical protein HFJ55_00305 [Clostridia bacterium]|jgi:hypothetical protein|nr:hypothetical protein [Clostridia bacterium]